MRYGVLCYIGVSWDHSDNVFKERRTLQTLRSSRNPTVLHVAFQLSHNRVACGRPSVDQRDVWRFACQQSFYL